MSKYYIFIFNLDSNQMNFDILQKFFDGYSPYMEISLKVFIIK
jgi:hypothetical protein